MHRASIVVAAFLMTVLSVCANLPAQATKEAIAPAAVAKDTAAAPAPAVSAAPSTPAEATSTPASAPAKKADSQQWLLFVMVGVFVLFYVWMGRGRKKEQKKRAEMLSTLKKGDKVTTIGGVTGIVMEASADEVVIKVDEASNTKIRFARWAIRGVGEDSKAENTSKK